MQRIPRYRNGHFSDNHISADDQHTQEDAEQGGGDALAALLANADEVIISENDGVQNISAAFDFDEGAGSSPEETNMVGASIPQKASRRTVAWLAKHQFSLNERRAND